MIELFLAFIVASLSFLALFLINLPADIKRESLRPLFLLVVVIGFWFATLPAFITPEITYTTAYPAYNVQLNGANVVYPAYNVTYTGQVSEQNYRTFFWLWLVILILDFFMILIWYLLSLRNKSLQAIRASSDALSRMEDEFGH